MPRRKLPRALIPNRKSRATAFAKRRDGLKKKAEELSILCGVRVAVVCAEGGGSSSTAAAADVWESEAGVLDAYRALPAGARAAHTHRAYAAADLGKEAAKLARVRQGGPAALPRWDKALDGVSLEEATRVLETVDAALAAAAERRRALGMPDHDDIDDEVIGGGDGGVVVLEDVAPLGRAAGSNFVDEGYEHGQGDTNGGGLYEQAVWSNDGAQHAMLQPGYGFHHLQYPGVGGGGAGMGGYHHPQQPQMAAGMNMNGYSNANARLAWSNNAVFQPRNAVPTQQQAGGYAAHCYGGGAMSGYGQQGPSSNNGGGFLPHLAVWSAEEQPRSFDGVYPSLDLGLTYFDGPPATHATNGGNFVNNNNVPMPPAALHSSSHAMGTGDNFTNPAQAQPLAACYGGGGDLINAGGYTATQWTAQQQQQQNIQSASSSQQSDIEQLNYFSDDVENAQLQLWGNN